MSPQRRVCLAVLLPEREDFLPPRRRLFGDVIVVGAFNNLETLRAGIAIMQLATEVGRNYFVRTGKQDAHGTAIILEPFGGVETITKNEPNRQEGHLSLTDRREVVVGRKHHQTRYAISMEFGQ